MWRGVGVTGGRLKSKVGGVGGRKCYESCVILRDGDANDASFFSW